MSLSRLLLPKPRFHFHNSGLPKPTRWFSSTSSVSSGETEKPSQLKKSDVAKEQRAVAAESYMEMHPGDFPKATQVQKKVGGSWYIIKGILTNLKTKMLGNPQFQHQTSCETPDSTVNTKASEVITTQNSPQNAVFVVPIQPSEAEMDSHDSKGSISTSATSRIVGTNSSVDAVDATASVVLKTHKCPDCIELGEPENIVQFSGAVMDSLSNEKSISMSVPSHIMGENSSEEMVNLTVTEISMTHNNPDNSELAEAEGMVQLSEAVIDSCSEEDNFSTSAAFHITGENSSEEMAQSEEMSNNSQVTKPDNAHRHLEEAISALPVGFDGMQKSKAEQLSCLTHQLLSEASRTLENDGADELSSLGNKFCQIERKTASTVGRANAGSEVRGMPVSSNGVQKVAGLADLFRRTMNDQIAGEVASEKSNTLTPNGFLKNSNDTSEEDIVKGFNMKGLIDYIKELPRELTITKPQNLTISYTTDQISSRVSLKRIQSQANLQNSEVKSRKTLLKGHDMGKESNKYSRSKEETSTRIPSIHTESLNKNEKGTELNVAACSHRKSETTGTFFTEKGTNENKLLLRFLHKDVKDSDIVNAFGDCGPIVKVEEFSFVKGSNFKDTCVHFETRKGLRKALQKTDLMVRSADAVMEVTSLEYAPNTVPIPSLIGDPDVPVALVKNPTQTVVIKQLTPDISSKQLKDALSFCGGGISSLFLGSSSSVAYVEFETEDAKERAIAKHSIHILEKQLLIFRIDVPRTTVVRISNMGQTCKKIYFICSSYGKVKKVVPRYQGIMDVHFKLAEWPNMLNILNSLNGMEVDGQRWLAQPAPVFPPAVLQILWNEQDERRRVKATMHSLLQKVEDPLDITEFTNLEAKYFGDEF